ncbi:ABC transporter substrate-binding protein [Aureimonas endophytica]|uniref:ABC transporter substrate-binding protein n=1 Tax=Aureimonas endophytica TaxID=2027858 RepID=A0A917A0R0_9HYPH|nr:ABC transporter substrate-binding protein [Aureimonas endophytica]GGE21239.1 ABC transporter substrate-binding protein [Aureimonas endophytica]
MKLFVTSLLAASLLTSASFAADQPVAGGRADLIVQPEPSNLMLGLVTNVPTQLVSGQIYEGLLRYDEKLRPMPSLAKAWEISPDGLTYTFHLNEGVTWHDGVPFSSADVLFSVNDFLTKTQPRHRNTMSRVAKVEAPDAATVVFTLKQPFEPFIRSFAFWSMPMVPKHIYENTDFATNPANEKPIGTGAFKFESWTKGSNIHLVKNEHYYLAGKPYLDDVYYHVVPDGASRAVAYETGTVGILPGGSVENFDAPRLAALENTCTTSKGREFDSPLSFIWLNNRKPPMDDKRFRQAVMYAMDRDFAREVLWNGLGRVATGPIAGTIPFSSKVEPQYAHDPAKAKALLAEMGYDGKPLKLLPLPYGETWQRWAEAVKQNLGEVGIPVEIEAADVAGWNQRLSEWNYDMAFTYMFQNGDPALGVERNYVSSQISKGSPWNNVEGYSSPKADALFAEAATAVPAEKRQALYDQVQAVVQEDVPVAWLLDLEWPTIYNCKFQDLVTTANGLNDSLRDTWIKP